MTRNGGSVARKFDCGVGLWRIGPRSQPTFVDLQSLIDLLGLVPSVERGL